LLIHIQHCTQKCLGEAVDVYKGTDTNTGHR